ncbi:fumarylacetoacetase [Acidisphaera sp. L21]|uniref:fumarylacetoacetase n=1 Tax=Acidisphaera sp. L21 TaxID=1641851 RepID=UPI00131B3336|nr:fumarylacetoacetase [Acidisphaera sp. L21]
MTLDETHDTARRSWVPGADDSDFTLQNLPLGIVGPRGAPPRPGIAIGNSVLDLVAAGLLPPMATLNEFLAQGRSARQDLRQAAWALLEASSPSRPDLLHALADCTVHLPCAIGDYTDFYAGIHHATNVGRLMRPDNPLAANYKHMPIAYHGRASSIRASGAPVRRPNGQRKPGKATEPSFGPSRNLDYELELGVWIGPGNTDGTPIGIENAADHIAGFCLLNDWSARDIQGWEAQPLGPFLAKSFITTISPWIITPEALAPYRCAAMIRAPGDPAPMPYLLAASDQAAGGLDLALGATLSTAQSREAGAAPHRLTQKGTSRDLYWTVAQMVAHHTSNGCDLRPGDLFGSGTISGTAVEARGSLLEMTEGGRQPIRLGSGEERRFLEDGDEVALTARFGRAGFGPCVGRVVG